MVLVNVSGRKTSKKRNMRVITAHTLFSATVGLKVSNMNTFSGGAGLMEL